MTLSLPRFRNERSSSPPMLLDSAAGRGLGVSGLTLPSNVEPTMSLADSAYNGNLVIETAWKHGAWPLHGIKKNAVYRRSPINAYQRIIQFFFNFPKTYATFYGKRNHAEGRFSMLGNRFGYRIRSRSKIDRKNEVQCKVVCHNIRMLAWNSIKVPVRV